MGIQISVFNNSGKTCCWEIDKYTGQQCLNQLGKKSKLIKLFNNSKGYLCKRHGQSNRDARFDLQHPGERNKSTKQWRIDNPDWDLKNYRDYYGHVAKQWAWQKFHGKMAYCTLEDFMKKMINQKYADLYFAWVVSQFNDSLAPIVIETKDATSNGARLEWVPRRRNVSISSEEKDEKQYRDRVGHIELIYSRTARYAADHKPPIRIESKDTFVKSSITNPRYNKLYEKWASKNYDNAYDPMITRIAYKGAYSMSNIKWVTKADVGLEDQQAQKDLMEHRSTNVEDIARVSKGHGIRNQEELRSWLKRMPGLYSHTTLDEIIKQVEAVFRRDGYTKYVGRV